MVNCECLLTSKASSVIADMLNDQGEDLTKPLTGVSRSAQLEEAEILVDVASDLYDKAKALVKDTTTPIKGGRFMSAGQAGNIEYSIGSFRENLQSDKEYAERDNPLFRSSLSLKSLATEFRDLAGRLALSCATGKKAI